jgi:hypothetical protein
MIAPPEATWSNQVDKKRARGINIKKQPLVKRLQKIGNRLMTEVAVQQATWKWLLDMMYLEAVNHNLKGDDETYKDASHNALGGY